jgi:flagellar biogenesis protein FliO
LKINQIIYYLETVTTSNLNNNRVSLFDDADIADTAADSADPLTTINNVGSMFWQMFIYFIAVAAVIAGLLFLRKYLMNRLGTVKSGSYMRVLDRITLAQDKQIVLMELKNKILIIGITQQRIETLAELSRDEFDVLEQDDNQAEQKNSNTFVKMLNDKLKTVDNKPNNESDENDKK